MVYVETYSLPRSQGLALALALGDPAPPARLPRGWVEIGYLEAAEKVAAMK